MDNTPWYRRGDGDLALVSGDNNRLKWARLTRADRIPLYDIEQTRAEQQPFRAITPGSPSKTNTHTRLTFADILPVEPG